MAKMTKIVRLITGAYNRMNMSNRSKRTSYPRHQHRRGRARRGVVGAHYFLAPPASPAACAYALASAWTTALAIDRTGTRTYRLKTYVLVHGAHNCPHTRARASTRRHCSHHTSSAYDYECRRSRAPRGLAFFEAQSPHTGRAALRCQPTTTLVLARL